MDKRSPLHELFVRVKTRMGLERFEAEKFCYSKSQSLGIYKGIWFWAKKNFAVFFRAGSLPNSKISLVGLTTYVYTFICNFRIFDVKTTMILEVFEDLFLTLFSTNHTFSWILPNFCQDLPWRTLAGKIWIACQRPSDTRKLTFLGRTSAGKKYI